MQGNQRISFAQRLKQNAAYSEKRRQDPNSSAIMSKRFKPYNEKDIAIAMSHATSSTLGDNGITHMQFAEAIASKTRVADTTLSVRRFQHHEQWAQMVWPASDALYERLQSLL
jgi:hypothetical protein